MAIRLARILTSSEVVTNNHIQALEVFHLSLTRILVECLLSSVKRAEMIYTQIFQEWAQCLISQDNHLVEVLVVWEALALDLDSTLDHCSERVCILNEFVSWTKK